MSIEAFLNKFPASQEETVEADVHVTEQNSLDKFLEMFHNPMESIWFYENTDTPIEVRFDKEHHKYYRVEELGNLTELNGVTNTVHIIDRSKVLTAWAAKKVAEKAIKLVPAEFVNEKFMVPAMELAYFTQLMMEAKKAPNEEKEEAGDIGHLAHQCLEDSIRYALDHGNTIVQELKNIPTDEKAATAAQSGFNWMKAHNVRWIKTESKIYSREHGYAGTLDGLAYVDSCNDRTCCRNHFTDHLSLIDWKSSNYLYLEFLFQTASYQYAEQEESGIKIEDRWILRLGKNEEEAGKFEPWYLEPNTFEQDFKAFLLCLNMVRMLDSVNDRMSEQKRITKSIKKEIKLSQKAAAKAEKKLNKARERAAKKATRAEEKAEAKRKAEEEKLALRIARAEEKARAKEEAKLARAAAKAVSDSESVRHEPSPVSQASPKEEPVVAYEDVVRSVPFFTIPMEK